MNVVDWMLNSDRAIRWQVMRGRPSRWNTLRALRVLRRYERV